MDRVPEVVIALILDYLLPPEIVTFAATSQENRRVCLADQRRWPRLFRHLFGPQHAVPPRTVCDAALSDYQLICRKAGRHYFRSPPSCVELVLEPPRLNPSVEDDSATATATAAARRSRGASLEAQPGTSASVEERAPVGALRFVHCTVAKQPVIVAASDQGVLAAFSLRHLPPSSYARGGAGAGGGGGSGPPTIPRLPASLQADIFAHAAAAKSRRDAKRKYSARAAQENKFVFFKIASSTTSGVHPASLPLGAGAGAVEAGSGDNSGIALDLWSAATANSSHAGLDSGTALSAHGLRPGGSGSSRSASFETGTGGGHGGSGRASYHDSSASDTGVSDASLSPSMRGARGGEGFAEEALHPLEQWEGRDTAAADSRSRRQKGNKGRASGGSSRKGSSGANSPVHGDEGASDGGGGGADASSSCGAKPRGRELWAASDQQRWLDKQARWEAKQLSKQTGKGRKGSAGDAAEATAGTGTGEQPMSPGTPPPQPAPLPLPLPIRLHSAPSDASLALSPSPLASAHGSPRSLRQAPPPLDADVPSALDLETALLSNLHVGDGSDSSEDEEEEEAADAADGGGGRGGDAATPSERYKSSRARKAEATQKRRAEREAARAAKEAAKRAKRQTLLEKEKEKQQHSSPAQATGGGGGSGATVTVTATTPSHSHRSPPGAAAFSKVGICSADAVIETSATTTTALAGPTSPPQAGKIPRQQPSPSARLRTPPLTASMAARPPSPPSLSVGAAALTSSVPTGSPGSGTTAAIQQSKGISHGSRLRADVWQPASFCARHSVLQVIGPHGESSALGSGQAVAFSTITAFADGSLAVLSPAVVSPKERDVIAILPPPPQPPHTPASPQASPTGASAPLSPKPKADAVHQHTLEATHLAATRTKYAKIDGVSVTPWPQRPVTWLERPTGEDRDRIVAVTTVPGRHTGEVQQGVCVWPTDTVLAAFGRSVGCWQLRRDPSDGATGRRARALTGEGEAELGGSVESAEGGAAVAGGEMSKDAAASAKSKKALRKQQLKEDAAAPAAAAAAPTPAAPKAPAETADIDKTAAPAGMLRVHAHVVTCISAMPVVAAATTPTGATAAAAAAPAPAAVAALTAPSILGVSGDAGGDVFMWSAPDMQKIAALQLCRKGAREGVSAVAVCAQAVVAGGAEGSVAVWRLRKQAGRYLAPDLIYRASKAHSIVRIIAVPPPSCGVAAVITGGGEGDLRLWPLPSGQSAQVPPPAVPLQRSGSAPEATRTELAPATIPLPDRAESDGSASAAASAAANALTLSSSSVGSGVGSGGLSGGGGGLAASKLLRGHSARITGLHMDNMKIVSSSLDGCIKLWDLQEPHLGRILNTVRLPPPCEASSLHVRGMRVLVGTVDGRAFLFDFSTGERDTRITAFMKAHASSSGGSSGPAAGGAGRGGSNNDRDGGGGGGGGGVAAARPPPALLHNAAAEVAAALAGAAGDGELTPLELQQIYDTL